MPETITYIASIAVTGGPKIGFTETLEVEAYNHLSVKVVKATSQKVFLGTDNSELRMLLVRSTKYDAAKVTFRIDATTKDRVLDMPFLIAGAAAISLFGATAPTSLTFKNDLAEDITIDIFIARDPTP